MDIQIVLYVIVLMILGAILNKVENMKMRIGLIAFVALMAGLIYYFV